MAAAAAISNGGEMAYQRNGAKTSGMAYSSCGMASNGGGKSWPAAKMAAWRKHHRKYQQRHQQRNGVAGVMAANNKRENRNSAKNISSNVA